MAFTGPKEKLLKSIGSLSGLDQIETVIRSKFQSEAPLLTDIPEYLFQLGGKRIRPILSLLTWNTFTQEKPRQELIQVAAGIELIHMATLLHDDIIDQSPIRRSQDSPYLKFGTGNTLLSGDFLLVRAFSLCAHLDTAIIDATEIACIELTEGEISETSAPLASYTVEDALEIARKKTASLFRLATETAGYLLEADLPLIEELRRFGEHLGISFQVLDDILDVTSTEDLLGKKAGIDIRERKPSVVNLLWLRSGDLEAKRFLLDSSLPSEEEIAGMVQQLKRSDVIEEARTIARDFAFQAKGSLQKALSLASDSSLLSPQIEQANRLFALADYTIDRLG